MRASGENSEERRAVVLGAGEAGRRVVSALHRRDGWYVLALLDDDPGKQGLRIAGFTVEGFVADLVLPHIVSSATHVIIAMPDASPERREQLLLLARQSGLAVLSVPDVVVA